MREREIERKRKRGIERMAMKGEFGLKGQKQEMVENIQLYDNE